MKHFASVCVLLVSGLLSTASVRAEQHRATRLGNPATRFAPPLSTPNDLRARFGDPVLRRDMIEVLRQWGWSGRVDDLFRAGTNAAVWEIAIPVGSTMPFMSSRENGRPICLRNVLWAGKEPAPAYAFNFTSNGQRYRCVTPKACSNFFLEDLGPEPVPALAIECTLPAQTFPGRTVEACLIVRNPGTAPVPSSSVELAVPPGAAFLSAAQGGAVADQAVRWEAADIAPGTSQSFCARFTVSSPGLLTFNGSATAAHLKRATTSCSTKVIGIPAILIDAVDLEDPIQVGSEVTYEIKVTNQGSVEATNVRLVFILPTNEEFVTGNGPTPVHTAEGSLATDPLPTLAPKGEALWRVVVKALQPGDVRFKIELSSDQFTTPIHEEESTRLY